MARAQDLIASAYRKLIVELPALDKLKLEIRLELRGRGDIQVFRVRTPDGAEIKGVEGERDCQVVFPAKNRATIQSRFETWCRETPAEG